MPDKQSLTKYVRLDADGAGRAGIKGSHYGLCLSVINKWASEAVRDFPQLDRDSIEVVVYGGNRWRKQFGIEFAVLPEWEVSDDYFRLRKLEETIAG